MGWNWDASCDTFRGVSTIQEIESAVKSLQLAEAQKLRQWLEDYLEDQLEFTDEFQAEIARSEKSMREGMGRVHKRGS